MLGKFPYNSVVSVFICAMRITGTLRFNVSLCILECQSSISFTYSKYEETKGSYFNLSNFLLNKKIIMFVYGNKNIFE